eukprot:6889481-Pyramimonas_sp.AAC.1
MDQSDAAPPGGRPNTEHANPTIERPASVPPYKTHSPQAPSARVSRPAGLRLGSLRASHDRVCDCDCD